jgi:pimeloyl-ACP methyl ester carboxylesterase
MFAMLRGCWASDVPVDTLTRRYARLGDRMVKVDHNFFVRVRDRGNRSKPTLLLLHGWGDSLEAWEPCRH